MTIRARTTTDLYDAESGITTTYSSLDTSEYPIAPSPRSDTLGGWSQTLEQSPPLSASCASSTKNTQPRSARFSRRWKVWQPHIVVIGFYVLAILLAATHCAFFLYLDGRIISSDVALSGERTTTVSQGYVTTTSLLLTTAFRAALLASLAVCYTQHLWATLKTNVLKVGLVEDLFQIQTNAFHLATTGIYSQTPVLAAVAIFCWLVPIVTVYPPGAVVVEILHSPIGRTFNVSALNAQDYMYATNPAALSEIWCNYVNGKNAESIGPLDLYREKVEQNASFLESCISRWSVLSHASASSIELGQTDDLRYITRSSLMSGEIASLSPLTGENSSYTIQFWGTTLTCETHNQTIQKTIARADIDVHKNWGMPAWMIRNFTTPCELWSNSYFDYSFEDPKINYRVARPSTAYRYFPCLDTIAETPEADQRLGILNLPDTGIEIIMDVTDTVCRPKLTEYSVRVSFAGGRQNVSYTLDDKQLVPAYRSSFGQFNGSYEQWVHFSDALSIYYEYAANLNRSTIVDYPIALNYTNSSTKSMSYTGSNGTKLETCVLNEAPIGLLGQYSRTGHRAFDLEIWPLSVFERRFFRPDPEWDSSFNSDCAQFDPEIAKELLINTTISALSLNKNFHPVDGVVYRVFNIYRFTDKLAFFLPYGLAIGLSIPIIALGLVGFYSRNSRTSAITGGFLQLLVTTTGRTLLENLIQGATTLGGRENISDELREAEITFGELIASDDEELNTDVDIKHRRSGFGLAQEVRQLQKRRV